jgi:hypothetical protein
MARVFDTHRKSKREEVEEFGVEVEEEGFETEETEEESEIEET